MVRFVFSGNCEISEVYGGREEIGYIPGPVVPMGISITAASAREK